MIVGFLLSFSVFVSFFELSTCQQQSPPFPNVVLYGEPRVIARRIIRTDMKTVRNLVASDDEKHLRHVNVLDNDVPVYRTGQETPVMVYRRVLRPARLTFTGDEIVSDRWIGTNDRIEAEAFTLSRRPSVITTIVHTGGN